MHPDSAIQYLSDEAFYVHIFVNLSQYDLDFFVSIARIPFAGNYSHSLTPHMELPYL